MFGQCDGPRRNYAVDLLLARELIRQGRSTSASYLLHPTLFDIYYPCLLHSLVLEVNARYAHQQQMPDDVETHLTGDGLLVWKQIVGEACWAGRTELLQSHGSPVIALKDLVISVASVTAVQTHRNVVPVLSITLMSQ